MESKAKFRETFLDYVRHKFDTELSNLTQIMQSKAMTRFYIDAVLRVVFPGVIPSDPDDLESCIVDGPDDCGVDFICRSGDFVLIIQSKYRSHDKPETPADVGQFCEVLQRLHPRLGAKFKKNEKLSDALGDIDWDNDFFSLHYIALGKVGDAARARIDAGPALLDELSTLEENRYDLVFCDERELNIKLREALSTEDTIEEPVDVRFISYDDGYPWLVFKTSGKRKMYIGYVSGSQIAELYSPHRFRLFAMNIRDWVGETATNKGISDTAANRPADFLYFNNGISAVASSVTEDAEHGLLKCKNFSIVNGAQTVRSIHAAHKKSPQSTKDVAITMRISTFSPGKEPNFLPLMTRYNNTQNKIAVSDFRSNDPVQKDLAVRFAELHRAGHPFWYKNKRSRERKGRVPIEMEEFAKTIHSFQYGPHDVWGGTGRLFDTGRDGRYAWVFGDGREVWLRVPDDYFSQLAGTWFLCEVIRDFWKAKKKDAATEGDPVVKGALERRYMVFFAVAELLRMVYGSLGRDLETDLRRFAHPEWAERDPKAKAYVEQYAQLAMAALSKAYATASKSEGFSHRNWFRERESLEKIRTELQFLREIRPDLMALPQ